MKTNRENTNENTSENPMKPRITVITLGVSDLDRAVAFYRDGLGWPTEGVVGREFEHGAVAFFELQSGLRLALWPRASIAHDSGVGEGTPNQTEMTLGHNVGSSAEVDAVMARAEAAGARIVKPAHETFWGGYAGYFQDPDGHLWEAVWNPAWEG
jgi:catechol 2,3-dioxygenase-like lactoylglutathione lyase family enzyme